MQYVAYLRVSTKMQEDSGLGLAAQLSAITREVGEDNIVKVYTEICSGTKDDRPQLAAAIAKCRETGATLIVSALDRLTRRVRFACEMLECGVQIAVVGMPNMSTMVFQILCVVAEEEARLIGVRVKAALKELKSQGKQLGGSRLGSGRKTKAKRTDQQQSTAKQIAQLRESGLTFEKIANMLNGQGLTAPSGGEWTKSKVRGFGTAMGVI